MFCPACAAELMEGAQFCMHCGASMTAAAAPISMFGCSTCGGDGSRLPDERMYCPQCRWLRPLGPGYDLPVEAYLWRLDADAMNVLRSLGPITAAAHMVSERVGRPWLEASVNGLRLSEQQMPEIFSAAIRAARIVGLSHLPELYISGDQMWEATTLGTDRDAFIVMGSVLINFKGDDLLFLLAREMGHCRAGHALWKTVSQFVSGRGHHKSILGDGVLKLFNPGKLVESAIDAPLMTWSRHAEITADRAGVLAIGNMEVARRVLQVWTFRSFPLLQRMNQQSWLAQEDQSGEVTLQVSEWTMTSTPYVAGRLRQLREFAATEEVAAWRRVIEHWSPPAPAPPPPPVAPAQAARPAAPPDAVRLSCATCKTSMLVPRAALVGQTVIRVRCPNEACRVVNEVRIKSPVPPPATTTPPAPAAGAPA